MALPFLIGETEADLPFNPDRATDGLTKGIKGADAKDEADAADEEYKGIVAVPPAVVAGDKDLNVSN